MPDSERYIASAEECERMAQSARTSDEHLALLKIAEHWRALAAAVLARKPEPAVESDS